MKDEPITKHSRYNNLFAFSVQTIIITKGAFLDLTMVTLLVKVKSREICSTFFGWEGLLVISTSALSFLQRKNEWSESFTIVTCVAKLFLIEALVMLHLL